MRASYDICFSFDITWDITFVDVDIFMFELLLS